ncbi:hypothetical protein OUZ56_004217 [Daphnia magna]|uniref:Uncharacterized protein n=1 Tax=Daphnia magna TaxID=35525 RepID=A0ABQ9YP32_9CRUS|nr:hypothetical protein OUZ56_004217 [Daphnia magna]
MAETRIGTWKCMHVRLDVALHVGGSIGNGQLEGFLFFTELYHFHGILNCLSADCHLASLEWYGPYQQCYDALLNTPIPQKIFKLKLWKFLPFMQNCTMMGFNNRNVLVVIRERYANRVSLFSIRNRNGFEEDIDGVLVLKKYMFVGRAPKSSGSFYYRTCYVRVKLKAKRRRMIQKLWERIIKELYSFRVTTRRECITSISITVSCVKTNPIKSSLVYSNSGSIFGVVQGGTWLGFASTFFISVSLIYPFCFKVVNSFNLQRSWRHLMCFIGVGVTRIITSFNGNKGVKDVIALEV